MPKKTENSEVPEVLPELLNPPMPSDDDILSYQQNYTFEQLAEVSADASEVFVQPTIADKNDLVGKPLVIVGWKFNPGEFGGYFVSVLAIVKDRGYVVFNDGSTGVRDQLKSRSERTGQQVENIYLANGLRRSDYWYDESSGETYTVKPTDRDTIPAATYYL